MTFTADYPGAIVVQARNYGYVIGGQHRFNSPKAWVLHTPEEPADNVPATPYYFAGTNRDASTTYFVSYLGLVFQCVPESEGAYANAVEGKPYPTWANPSVNLNLQTLSVEIEGFAATIHQTMSRGSAQWKALVGLMAHRCAARGIPPERTIGHYQVSVYRSDPGQLNIPLLIEDVRAKMEENGMGMTPAELDRLVKVENALKQTVGLVRFNIDGGVKQYTAIGGFKVWVPNPATLVALGLNRSPLLKLTAADALAALPELVLVTSQVGLKRGDTVTLG